MNAAQQRLIQTAVDLSKAALPAGRSDEETDGQRELKDDIKLARERVVDEKHSSATLQKWVVIELKNRLLTESERLERSEQGLQDIDRQEIDQVVGQISKVCRPSRLNSADSQAELTELRLRAVELYERLRQSGPGGRRPQEQVTRAVESLPETEARSKIHRTQFNSVRKTQRITMSW